MAILIKFNKLIQLGTPFHQIFLADPQGCFTCMSGKINTPIHIHGLKYTQHVPASTAR